MKKNDYTLNANMPLNDAIVRISDLLDSEHVSYKAEANIIGSTEIPLPFWSWDKRLYTRKNWIGFNPFIFISSIDFILKEISQKETHIEVIINQKRAMFLFRFFCFLFLGIMVAVLLSANDLFEILVPFLIFSAMLFIAWLFIFRHSINLIKTEIIKALQ